MKELISKKVLPKTVKGCHLHIVRLLNETTEIVFKNKKMLDLIIEMSNNRGLDLPPHFQERIDIIANEY